MMNLNENKTITFLRNDEVSVKIDAGEYKYIDRIANSSTKDIRCIRGIIKTYAIIKLFTAIDPHSEYVPIHSEVFRFNVSGKNYIRYRELLRDNHAIDYKSEVLSTYNDTKGQPRVKCESPMQFRCLTMSYMGNESIFPPNNNVTEVRIKLKPDIYRALKQKCKLIEMVADKSNKAEKVAKILANDNNDTYVSMLLVKLIKDAVTHKINSKITWNRRVRAIAKVYQREDTKSLTDKQYIIESLAIRVIVNIYEIKKKKEFEHIAENFLSQSVRNQMDKCKNNRSKTTGELSFYNDLSVDLAGLDYVVQLQDLHQIARISEKPHYNHDGKLYSAFANLRREIRKYVRYNDDLLIEASDIHSAHFTMLPLIFKQSNISISASEMNRFKVLTQTKDLYSEVIKGSALSRDNIKPVFQSFFSIKNEKQYLFDSSKADHNERALICTYFKTNFPEIYAALLGFHQNHTETIKSVANRVESEIMNPICKQIIAEGLHPFRLHDAIYLTKPEMQKTNVDITNCVFNAINSSNYAVC